MINFIRRIFGRDTFWTLEIPDQHMEIWCSVEMILKRIKHLETFTITPWFRDSRGEWAYVTSFTIKDLPLDDAESRKGLEGEIVRTAAAHGA